MIQFTCRECGGEEWTVHGGIRDVGEAPDVEEIRCAGCGNREEAGSR